MSFVIALNLIGFWKMKIHRQAVTETFQKRDLPLTYTKLLLY